MDLVNSDIESYIDNLVQPTETVAIEMEAIAKEKGFPIIGPQVARLLSVIVRAMKGRRVLELGSGYGYSALHFAEAVGASGEVIMTESSGELSEQAMSFLSRAGLAERVRPLIGEALQLARTFEDSSRFDVIFNDIDKEDYPEVLEVARRLLRPGGLLICDNMLWYGRVLEPEPGDEATAGVVELTRRLRLAEDFETSWVPIRDGVTLSYRR